MCEWIFNLFRKKKQPEKAESKKPIRIIIEKDFDPIKKELENLGYGRWHNGYSKEFEVQNTENELHSIRKLGVKHIEIEFIK